MHSINLNAPLEPNVMFNDKKYFYYKKAQTLRSVDFTDNLVGKLLAND